MGAGWPKGKEKAYQKEKNTWRRRRKSRGRERKLERKRSELEGRGGRNENVGSELTIEGLQVGHGWCEGNCEGPNERESAREGEWITEGNGKKTFRSEPGTREGSGEGEGGRGSEWDTNRRGREKLPYQSNTNPEGWGGGWGGSEGWGGGGGGGGDRGERGEVEAEGQTVQSRRLRQPPPKTAEKEDDLNALKLIYLNACSLMNKINDLCVLINDSDPDVILITETWCSEEISNAMLNIPGYFIEPELRLDRTDTMNGIGGGLLVYVKDNLIVKPIPVENNFNMFKRFEIISNESKDDGRFKTKPNLTVTLVYRPPRSRNENTQELCKLFRNSGENSLFIGDFNFPTINWSDQTSDRNCEPFLQCVIDNNFEQLVTFPTHVRGNILDLVFANRPENILNIEALGNLSNSDHTILSVDVIFRSKFNSSEEMIHDWKNGDTEGLKEYLRMVNWNVELDGLDAEECWYSFKGKLESGINQFIPKARRRKNNNHQWMTRQVKRIVRQKQRHYNLYQADRTKANFDQYKKTEKACKKSVRSAKRKFEQNIAKNGNKRPFNSYIKSKTASKINIGPLKVGNNLVSDNLGMATILNNTFSSVFTEEDLSNVPFCPSLSQEFSVSDVHFDLESIKKKIMKLKCSSSSGPDNISSRFLQNHVDSLVTPLSIIFSKSLESGVVPQDWRDANVTPIFKKGAKNSPDNYRPVSLTSIPCKIMESIMKDEIIDYLLRYQLINPSQHGFMPNKSCATNLLVFLEKITDLFDNSFPVDVVFLDFSKAFDKVPHKRLLAKMEQLGIRGNLLKWTESWLTNRKQRTVLNGTCSTWTKVISGVPQGSVLGPLLFVIFINDIDNFTRNITIMLKFADDTKLGNVASGPEDFDNLQQTINDLLVWADTWCMKFNTAKCKVLHLGRSNTKHIYNMNGSDLQSIDSERDIGVLMSCNLKPSLQCTQAANRASAILKQITRAFMYRDRKVFLLLYKQFVRCHLEFAIPAWSPWLVQDIEILERVQKRAVNFIVGLSGRTYEDKLRELKITSLAERRKKFDMVQTFKILNGHDRVDSSIWFKTVGDNANRLTRNTAYRNNLVATRSRTDIRKNFFSNRVVNLWNSLPTDVKDARTVKLFKARLEKINL